MQSVRASTTLMSCFERRELQWNCTAKSFPLHPRSLWFKVCVLSAWHDMLMQTKLELICNIISKFLWISLYYVAKCHIWGVFFCCSVLDFILREKHALDWNIFIPLQIEMHLHFSRSRVIGVSFSILSYHHHQILPVAGLFD